jgi:hypothetical protein
LFITRKSLSRRTVLRGLGASLSLPLLDAMVPAFAQSRAPKSPVRLAWFYHPNGIDMRHFTPREYGPLTDDLPQVLAPLAPHRRDLNVLSHLTAHWGRPLLAGAGDHGRALAAYMTGMEVAKEVTNLRSGISADQVAANAIGHLTRLPSLEVGLEEARMAGNCDNGYSCAYVYNVSWKTASHPLPPIADPRLLFERLFGTDADISPEARARRFAMRSSILDNTIGDTEKLVRALGGSDQRKLDEYLTSVREVELQVERAATDGMLIDPGIQKPFGVPADFGDYYRLMTDMMLIAFRADITRISTMMVGREGSTRAYPEIGIPDGHHPLTHHRGNADMLDKVTKINVYHAELFAGFIDRLRATEDGDSNLLDQSLIVYGAGIADGNDHTHDQLPTVLVGRGGGTVRPGRHIVYQRETPITNLFTSMIETVGVSPDYIGDSTGRLSGLA